MQWLYLPRKEADSPHSVTGLVGKVHLTGGWVNAAEHVHILQQERVGVRQGRARQNTADSLNSVCHRAFNSEKR